MLEEDEENCRDSEESLEVAVLEAGAATDVVRAMKASFCMRRKRMKLMIRKECMR